MTNQSTQEVDLLIKGGVVITMDAERRIYDPGFVNAHDHLDQSVYRSCSDEKPGSRGRLLRMAQ